MLLAGLGALAVVAVGVGYRAASPSSPDEPDTGAAGAGTGRATIERRSLSSTTPVNGVLGYAGEIAVVNRVDGTATALPEVGQIVAQGEVLYRVDNSPVLLLYGDTPAYRDLAAGSTASATSGPDVRQLNAALVALGHAEGTGLDPGSDQFSWLTRQAVRNLQQELGVDRTGSLALGSVVFVPSELRVTAVEAVEGGPLQSGVTLVTGTTTTPVVTVDLDAARQSLVEVGDAVAVSMPDLTTAEGEVTSVSSVAATDGGSDSATVRIEITLADSAGAGADQSPVLVSITTDTVDDALVVPVTSLLALAGGGYAVEVVDGGARTLVPVELGLFDDTAGLVQVISDDLEVGQEVVVPS